MFITSVFFEINEIFKAALESQRLVDLSYIYLPFLFLGQWSLLGNCPPTPPLT